MRHFIILLGFLLTITQCLANITGHISTTDQQRLKSALEKSAITSNDDFASVYYSSRGYKLLNHPVQPVVVKTSCKNLQDGLAADLTLEKIFYIVLSWKQLGCPQKLASKDLIEKVKKSLNDKSSAADIYYGVETLVALDQTVPDAQKLSQTLQTRLKTDDSLINFGYTFHAASKLGPAGLFAYERIEDVVVQADEIDQKMLQFEGGLGVTSLILSGMIRLSESLKKSVPLTNGLVEKFSNYLLSRRSVQSAKGIACLLEATKAITDTKLSPPCIAVQNSGVVSQDKLFVKLCDMLGKPLGLPEETIIAQSATRLLDDVVVLSKQKLIVTSDPTVYELELKHDPGKYKIALNAGPYSAAFTATVLGTVQVTLLEIGVSDTDQGSPSKLQKLQYGSKLPSILEADSQQRLVIRFALDGRIVHQAFIRLACQQSNKEILFVAEVDNNGIYKFDMDIGVKATELGIKSGKYNIELIVGDPIISNPFVWTLGTTELKITGSGASAPVPIILNRGVRPEIKHMFREPERRPPPVISTLFTALVVAPFVILLGMWIKLGVNISNFKFSFTALIFHLGLGAIFVLFFVFWLKLDMFTTSRWLLLFGLITFLSGHRVLSTIAKERCAQQELEEQRQAVEGISEEEREKRLNDIRQRVARMKRKMKKNRK